MLSLHAQFGVGECFSTGDEMGVFLLVGEVVVVVVVVMVVVNIVGVVGTQGEHSEECNIEEGTLAEVVGEVVVRRVAEKEPKVVPALELVGGEAAFGDMHLKGLRCRKVLHTLFWQPLPRCLFFFSSSLTFPYFHGLPCCCFFSFSFLSMWVILGILVSLMLLLSLLLLGSVVIFWLLELSLALLIVLLLLLLVKEPWFGFEEGMQLDFFPLVWGNSSSSGSPRTSPLGHLF